MRTQTLVRWAAALAAAGLVWSSSTLPLWTMRMHAPQYPKGLQLQAYGTRMAGDLRELNILNHYIGMAPIEMPAFERAMFPIGLWLLIALCLLAPLHRHLRTFAILAVAATPFVIMADLQWWLYDFGHSLDPHAPIRLKPFTPRVIGSARMGNFSSSGLPSWGLVALWAAALALVAGAWLERRRDGRGRESRLPQAAALAAALAGVGIVLPATVLAETSLQARIAAAPAGGTVAVEGGVHKGPLVIRGPLTLVGVNRPVIDGGGRGSVVTLEGNGVVFRGFLVRNSGREVTEEAAGIKTSGDGHRIVDNHLVDVYFGVHLAGGAGHVVERNSITPGTARGARPGHGISVWHVRGSRIDGNVISEARDGVYLSFTDGVAVSNNEVARCRYGLHSMSSVNAAFTGNRLRGNLLGAAMMQSDRLLLRGNRIEEHRDGAAAYGVLLKDIGSLLAEDNVIVSNRVAVYAEGVPTKPGADAVLRRNVIAGNEVGLSLQSSAALTVAGNRIADNLADVRALGRMLSPGMRWTSGGRGNFWSEYRGYDADGDGIGDLPHRAAAAMDALIRQSPLAQAFLHTPAHLAIEAAARMFPLYPQPPLLVDERPVMAGGTR